MSFMSRRRDKTVRAAYLMIGRLKEEIQKAERRRPGGLLQTVLMDRVPGKAANCRIQVLIGQPNVFRHHPSNSTVDPKHLNRFELSQSDLLTLGMGAWRISRVRIGETSIKAENDGYTVMFTLPKGSYATCLLRELVTPEVQ